MMTFFSRQSLGSKLSVLIAGSVAVIFLAFTLLLSEQASRQLNTVALQDIESQASGIKETAQMFNSSLNAEVTSYSRLFDSFLPHPITINSQQKVDIAGNRVPELKGGDVSLHQNNTFSDDFLARSGAISTLFVRNGDDFVRVATSLRKEDGTRAMGTLLDRSTPAWAKVSQGEVYRGLALLFGKRYITQYQPVKDAGGQTIAVLFVGVDITDSWNLMRDKVLSRKLGESGHFYVLNSAPGKNRGQYLFHPSLEGKMPDWPDTLREQVLTQPEGAQEWMAPGGDMASLTWVSLPDWKWVIVGDVNKASLLSSITHMRNQFLLAGALLVILFAAACVWITRRWLSQPLQTVVALARQYASGDLRQSIATARQDEVGLLIHAINGIGEGLNNIVTQVRQTATEINEGTDALAAGSDVIGEQMTRQASSVEETSASMAQLAATVAQNADNMSHAYKLVANTTQAAHSGGLTVDNAVSTMEAIREASQRIADITHVIESIAFQTNILALNAAVEAARAGEHGKGFAVVAQEVRALAARSANSVKEIDQLIADTLNKVEEGHTLSQKTRQSMGDITAHIEQINTLVSDISKASHEQSSGISHVNTAMSQIGEATHISAQGISHTEEIAHQLRAKSHQLSELVSLFKTAR